jgi:hypothetical protein
MNVVETMRMMEAQASDSSLNNYNNDGDSSLITNTKNNGG